MGWLEWCKKKYPTYPWRREGCRLILPDGVVDEFRKVERFQYEQGIVGGKNAHGDGDRYVLERGVMKWDVPFWATKWLVFDRDQKCQSCGQGQFSRYEDTDYPDDWDWVTRTSKSGKKPVTRTVTELLGYRLDPTSNGGDRGSVLQVKFEVHHIIPVSRGGSNCTHNTVLLCETCHGRHKGRGGPPTGSEQQRL